ncbi:MAG: glycosyltransferase [Clostridia bacterium]|nr:glycosyltransferase [Clostridia bacterium]
MMKQPLVSIIVPIYNVEPYLVQCIESIINQTYKNLEIILVDDGSPDNCPKICDDYASRDSRIVVIHKKNGGLSDARNAGLDIAQGDYITFVDSDDWIHSNYIEILSNGYQNKKIDIVIGEHDLIGENIKSQRVSFNENSQIYDARDIIKIFFSNNSDEKYGVAWGKLYKKELFANVKFPKGKYHEDNFLTPILLHKANKIFITNKVLYHYRIRSNSITSKKHPFDLLEALESSYFHFKKINDSEICNLIIPQLCWKLLYLYNRLIMEKETIPAKGILEKINLYKRNIIWSKLTKKPTIILLHLFLTYPFLYHIYRVISPITIRKDF